MERRRTALLFVAAIEAELLDLAETDEVCAALAEVRRLRDLQMVRRAEEYLSLLPLEKVPPDFFADVIALRESLGGLYVKDVLRDGPDPTVLGWAWSALRHVARVLAVCEGDGG